MGYTITSQSSRSIHAGQTWSLVKIAVIPAVELTFVTLRSTATPSPDSAPDDGSGQGTARGSAQEVSFFIPLSGYSALDHLAPSVAQQTAHRGLAVGAALNGSDRAFFMPAFRSATCRSLALHKRELLLGADAGQGPLPAQMRSLGLSPRPHRLVVLFGYPVTNTIPKLATRCAVDNWHPSV